MHNTWKDSFKLYLDKRMAWIFLMGVCSGFPAALIGSNLSGWLNDSGISRADIGLLGSVSLVYAINFLWAPLLDKFRIPIFNRFGTRRSWVLLSQTFMLFILLVMVTVNPANELFIFGVLAFSIACCSATQDVAIDAFRIDQFGNNEAEKFPAAAAMSVIGWWTGYSGPGYLAFSNADALGWNTVYQLMIVVLIVLMLTVMAIGDNSPDRSKTTATISPANNTHSHWFYETLVQPFAEFFTRNGVRIALTLLLFIFLFKIGEAFLGRMSVVFYREVGFSNDQIATYSKAFGWFLTVIFTLLGSLFNTRFGVIKGLLVGGAAMASSNLLFALIAKVGPSESLFAITLVVDNFTAAFSSVALVAFLSAITGRTFSASQYALFASIGNFGRISLAGVSGHTVDWLGSWELFFIMTSIMVVPSLLLLVSIRKKLAAIIQNG